MLSRAKWKLASKENSPLEYVSQESPVVRIIGVVICAHCLMGREIESTKEASRSTARAPQCDRREHASRLDGPPDEIAAV